MCCPVTQDTPRLSSNGRPSSQHRATSCDWLMTRTSFHALHSPSLHRLPTVPTGPAWGAVRSLIQQVGAKCSFEPGGGRSIRLAPGHAAATIAAAADASKGMPQYRCRYLDACRRAGIAYKVVRVRVVCIDCVNHANILFCKATEQRRKATWAMRALCKLCNSVAPRASDMTVASSSNRAMCYCASARFRKFRGG